MRSNSSRSDVQTEEDVKHRGAEGALSRRGDERQVKACTNVNEGWWLASDQVVV